MKKAGIFALVIALVLLVMQFYNYKLYAYTEAAGFVIDTERVEEELAKTEEEPEGTLPLLPYEAGTPLYKRGDKRFIGEAHTALSLRYPAYMNDGAWLYSFSDEMQLVASDFTSLDTYEGLYLTDGTSYNADGSEADPDEFVFLAAGGGLFFNAQPMKIISGARTRTIPENSILSLGMEEVRYYSYAEGGLQYGSYADLLQADVEIGSLRLSYEELLRALERWTEEGNGAKDKERAEETESETEAEIKTTAAKAEADSAAEDETLSGEASDAGAESELQNAAAEDVSGEAETVPAGGEADTASAANGAEPNSGAGAQTAEHEKSTASDGEKKKTESAGENGGGSSAAESTEAKTPGETEEPTHPPYPGKTQKWSFGGDDMDDGDDGSGDSARPGRGDHAGSGNDGGSGSGDAGGSGSGSGSGSGTGGKPQGVKPDVVFGDFTFGVYDAAGSISINDPQGMIRKGVRLIFYKKGETRSVYRKLYKTSGNFEIKPLEPDTEFEAEAYFDYRDENGAKQREAVIERKAVGRTLSRDCLVPISLTHTYDERAERYPNAIRLTELAVSDELSGAAASPSEAADGKMRYSAIPYITSLQMNLQQTGITAREGTETSLGSVSLGQLKNGTSVSWKTADVLSSNRTYHYTMKLYDRYGAELKLKTVTAGSGAGSTGAAGGSAADAALEKRGAEGEAYTSKAAPTAAVSIDRNTPINALKLAVNIKNPDGAEYAAGTNGISGPYLILATAENPNQPISFTVEGKTETDGTAVSYTAYPLGGKETELVLTSLLPNKGYRMSVRASYLLEDNFAENGGVHRDEELGSVNYTTASLSSLGTVNWLYTSGESDIRANSADIRARIRTNTEEALRPFLTEYVLNIKNGSETAGSYALTKEALEQICLQPGADVTVYEKTAGSAGSGSESADGGSGGTAEAAGVLHRLSLRLASDVPKTDAWTALYTNNATLTASCEELSSATNYTAELRAYAVRGAGTGADSAENVREEVTGRYYSYNFKTMKARAAVSYDTSFINGSRATFYELRVTDQDGAVTGDALLVRLVRVTNSAAVEMRSYTMDELNALDSLSFDGLSEGTDYRLEIVATEYNEGYTNKTREQMKRLQTEDLDVNNGMIVFTAKDSLIGSLRLDNIQREIKTKGTAADGITVQGGNLIDANAMTLGYTLTDGELTAFSSTAVTDFIAVDREKVYLFGTSAGSGGATLSLYNADQNFLSAVTYASDGGNYFGPYGFRAAKNVAYVRIAVSQTNVGNAFFMEAKYAENDGAADLLKSGDALTEGKALSHDNGGEQTYSYAAYTDYIEVEPGAAYVRITDGMSDTNNYWPTGGVNYYDENYNRISGVNYISTIYNQTAYNYRVPEGAAFMRLNVPFSSKDDLRFLKVSDELHGENLLADAVWNKSAYINAYGNIDEQNNDNNRYSDFVKVEPTALYEVRGSYGLQVLDQNRQMLGYIGRDHTNGYKASFLCRMPEDAAYVRMNNYILDSVAPMLRQVLPGYSSEGAAIVLDASLTDYNSSLGDEPSFELRVRETDANGKVTETSETIGTGALGADRHYSAQLNVDAKRGANYEIEMVVKQGGRDIVLASASVDTARIANIIRSETALMLLKNEPWERFVVSEDIELTGTWATNARFYGEIDFAGHTLRKANLQPFFAHIQAGAVVENAVFEIEYNDAGQSWLNTSGLVNENNGTIRNIVMKFTASAFKEMTNFGGLCYTNNGVIENAALELMKDVRIQNNFAVGVSSNTGTIRNSYVAAIDGAKLLAPDDGKTEAKGYRTGICRWSAGTIENVYAALEIEEAFTEGTSKSGASGTGLVLGSNSGTVKGAFGVGMVLSNGVPSASYGPAIGSAENATSVERVYYVQTRTIVQTAPYYVNAFNERVSAASLYDPSWMNGVINDGGQYDTAVAADGYYPQLKMPESMSGKQPLLKMPSQGQATVPRMLSATVTEQTEEDAAVRFVFENRSSMTIKDIGFSTRELSGGQYLYTKIGMNAEILDQGKLDDLYYVDAKLHIPDAGEPKAFRSRYYVDSFTYEYAQTETVSKADSDQRIEVRASFYQPIRNFDDWANYFGSNKGDTYGNYRLIGADDGSTFDFSTVGAADWARYRRSGTLSGKVTGAWTDADGNRHVTALKNIAINDGSNASLFQNLTDAQLRDLKVEGMSLSYEGANTSVRAGLVNWAKTSVIENVHVKDVEISGTVTRASGLVGEASLTRITGCSVTNLSFTSKDAGGRTAIAAGGIAGVIGNYCTIESSYASGIRLDAMDSSGLQGVGGLVGYANTYDTLKNAYAAGEIRATGRYIGGLVGYANMGDRYPFENCYSRVNITAYGGTAGGLAGYYTVSRLAGGNVAAGDVFMMNQNALNVHRLVGQKAGSQTVVGGNYAYADQIFNVADSGALKSADADDAERLLSRAELMNPETYTGLLGWSTEVYDFAGTERGVSLPLLKDTESYAFPYQINIPFSAESLRLEVEELSINNAPETEWNAIAADGTAFPLAGSGSMYGLTFYVRGADAHQYEIQSVSIESMKLNDRLADKDAFTTTEGSAEGGEQFIRRRYPFLQAERGADQYLLQVVLRKKGAAEGADAETLTLRGLAKPENQIAKEIPDAKTWNEVMATESGSYGNYVLTGDIDETTLNGESLIMNVRANSITARARVNASASEPAYYGFKNIKREIGTDERSVALFRELMSSMKNVSFTNCAIKVPNSDTTSKHELIGFVGTNYGVIENVSFDQIEIAAGVPYDFGNSVMAGCVANNLGMIQNVSLTDVKVSAYGRYVGGLAGRSDGSKVNVRNITARGSLAESEKEKNAGHAGYTSSYEVRGAYSTGGILGYGAAADLDVSGIRVVGETSPVQKNQRVTYIGGMIGEGAVLRASSDIDDSQKNHRSKIADSLVETIYTPNDTGTPQTAYPYGVAGAAYGTSYYVDGENLLVCAPGASYVGGLFGSGAPTDVSLITADGALADAAASAYTIKKTRVCGGTYVGGIAGTISASSAVVRGVEVEASESYAGGIGGNAYSTISTMLVENTSVKAGWAAGGVIGSSNNASITNNVVIGSTVETIANAAGGIAGIVVSDKGATFQSNGVVDTVIRAGKAVALAGDATDGSAADTGTTASGSPAGSSEAGGIVGCYEKSGTVLSNYTKNVTLLAEGDYVGGLAGRANGGLYYFNYTHGELETSGSHAGGFVGGLATVNRTADQNAAQVNAKLYNNYTYMDVTAADYAAGMIGSVENLDGYALDESSFYANLMIGNVRTALLDDITLTADDASADADSSGNGADSGEKTRSLSRAGASDADGSGNADGSGAGNSGAGGSDTGSAAGTHADFIANPLTESTAISSAYLRVYDGASCLRVYDGASCQGVTAATAVSDADGTGGAGSTGGAGGSASGAAGSLRFAALADYKTTALGGTIRPSEQTAEQLAKLKETLRVSRDELMDYRTYNYSGNYDGAAETTAYSYGDLAWANYFDLKALGRMDEIPQGEKVGYTVDYTNVEVKDSSGKTVKLADEADSFGIDYQTAAYRVDMRGNEVPTAKIVLSAADAGKTVKYQWYRRVTYAVSTTETYVSRAISGATGAELPLAGRGYYVGTVTIDGKEYRTPLIAVDSAAYLPMATYTGNANVRGAQEGIDEAATEANGVLTFYNGTDDLYYGGVPMPEEIVTAEAAAFMMNRDETLSADIYPSGVNTVNVELSADYDLLSEVTVSAGGKTLYQAKPAARVLTLPYDYRESVQVVLKAGGAAETEAAGTQAAGEAVSEADAAAAQKTKSAGSKETAGKAASDNTPNANASGGGIFGGLMRLLGADSAENAGAAVYTNTVTADATALRRTVMICGDQYYYTYDGKLMSAEGTVLDEAVLHLYGGKALTADGEVVTLPDGAAGTSADAGESSAAYAALFAANAGENGSAVMPADADGASDGGALDGGVPMYRGEADGSELSTYLHFTEVETDGAQSVQEGQLFAKNGELYALSNARTDAGLVLDSYNGATYLSVLNEKGRLTDIADPLNVPEGFKRDHIAHMTTSLSANAPYVLVRYQNGAAAGFNYVTGEALPIESAVTDASLFEFAGEFTSNLFGDGGGENLAFADLKLLKEKLTIHPLTAEQLGAAKMYADGAVSGGDHALADGGAANAASGETANSALSGNEAGAAETGTANETGGNASAGTGTEAENAQSKAAADGSFGTENADGQPTQAADAAETGAAADPNTADGAGASNADASADSAYADGGLQDEEAAQQANAEENSGAAENTVLSGDEAGAAENANANGMNAAEIGAAAQLNTADGAGASNADASADSAYADGGLQDAEAAQRANAEENANTGAQNAEAVRPAGADSGETKADAQAQTNGAGNAQAAAGGANTGADGIGQSGGQSGATAQESASADAGAAEAAQTGAEGIGENADGTEQTAEKKLRYAYAFDAASGKADLYRSSELLGADGAKPMSETEKIELAKKAGVLDMNTQSIGESAVKEKQHGIYMIGTAVAAAIGLCVLLIRRKRSDIKFFVLFLLVLGLSSYAAQTVFAEGFSEENGAWYYYDASGAPMKNQWINSYGVWYYMGANGKMRANTSEEIGEKRYFFGDDGQMLTGWISAEFEAVDDSYGDAYRSGGVYYAGADGAAICGWKYLTVDDLYSGLGQQWFYFRENGRKAASQSITETAQNGSRYRYTFDEYGVMYDSKLVYDSDPDPKPANGRWLKHVPAYSEDAYASEFNVERWYYLTKSEQLVKNQLRQINGATYLFDANGIMKTGLVALDENGKYKETLVQEEEGVFADSSEIRALYGTAALRCFDEKSGKMRSGEISLSLADGTFTLGITKSGALLHGVQNGKLYDRGLRVDADADLRYEIVTLDGRQYLVTSGGRVVESGTCTDADGRKYTVTKTGDGYRITVS